MAVGTSEAACEVQCSFEVGDDSVVVLDAGDDLAIEGFEFGLDPFLISFHELDCYGFGVVGLKQFRLFLFELDSSPCLNRHLGVGFFFDSVQFIEDVVADLVDKFLRGFNVRVVVDDVGFDDINEHGLLLTASAALLAADADEVRVDRSVLAAVVADDQA